MDTSGRTAIGFEPGIAHETLDIVSGDRHLVGVYVHPAADGPLLLIFHGNGEAVGDWSKAQAFLFHQGVGSIVFDYSGFGNSTGKPTIDNLRQDGQAAYTAARAKNQRPGVFVLAHSLGCNVALDAVPGQEPQPLGYALWGCMSSLRSYTLRTEHIPGVLRFLIPDRWDNAAAAQQVHGPVLVLHGTDDKTMTLADSEAVARAASDHAGVFQVAGAGHNALYLSPDTQTWGPILDWVSRLVPAARKP